MDHQSQIEKLKYRNWVRGGLVYKYLKEGIENFADEVVVQEHKRILQDVNHTPGLTCNQCCLRTLRPPHNSKKDPNTGKAACPRGQVNCNCLFKNKLSCQNKMCDKILEEILETHDSAPPAPYWKNTDIKKWCSTPWEVAKCFINAPGYADKTKASDIDAPGLLHVFINNINLQTNLACKITGTDVLNRVLRRRNTLFHSATMELEDKELNELIDDVIEILEDEKELKANHDAIKAVEKLRQLKEDAFIVTTRDEVEVCRATMASVDKEYEELKQAVEDCKSCIESKESHVKQTADNANVEIDNKKAHTLKSIHDKTEDTKKEIDFKETMASQSIDDKLEEAKKEIYTNQAHASKFITDKLEKAKIDIDTKQTQVLKSINDETEQAKIELNKQNDSRFRALKQTIGSLKERVRDLEQDNAVIKRFARKKILDLYQKHYVKTGISPLKKQDNDININEVYVTPKMTVDENDKVLNKYRDIFRTDGSLHKKIYIVGDVGSGKSSISKMMINNWCKPVKSEDETNATPANGKAPQSSEEFDDVNEIRRFNFVFFIPLQRMSKRSSSLVEMIRLCYKNIVTSELLDRILAEESEHCLIIADGLDEWTPSETEFRPEHVSYGLPLADGLHNATVITLSRPSAKGILNMKTSEYDLKIILQGIDSRFMNEFILKYMSKQPKNQNSSIRFLHEIRINNLEHLEKTPLLLQQLVWMYCMGHGIGKTVGEIYSNVVNIMFGWSNIKDYLGAVAEGEIRRPNEFQEMQLPMILKRFPRCEASKRYILQLGKIAFNASVADISTSTFGSLSLLNSGLLKNDIATLTSVGILVEYNCIDPTFEDVYFSFVHTSYLEFFAAVYISSQNNTTTALEKLFKKYKLTSDILQLSNLLKLLLELSPYLLKEISKLISICVETDESVIRYRNNLEYMCSCIPYEVEQLQRLVYNCLYECDTGDQPVASICDIDFLFGFNMSILRRIIPRSVLSLNFHSSIIHFNESQDILKWAVQLHRLQYICIDRNNSYGIQCSVVQEIASFVQKVVSLKHIVLKYVECSDPNCRGHVIDLSKHNQLHNIHLENCSYQVVSFENSDNLNHIYVSNCDTKHVVRDQFISSLTKSVSLKHITLIGIKCFYTDCSRLTFNLSEHFKLHSIHVERCPFQVGSLGNTEYLENVYISECPSDQCDVLHTCMTFSSRPMSIFSSQNDIICKLASSLTQAVSLNQLTLRKFKFCIKTCKIYSIDLSKHDQLQSLEVLNIPEHLAVLNIRTAQNLSIPTQMVLSKSLCDISKLQYLEICGIPELPYDRYTISMNSIVQALQQLKSLTLKHVHIDDNALIVSPRMQKLRKIILSMVLTREEIENIDYCKSETNVPTWCSFLDSLLTLKQSVNVTMQYSRSINVILYICYSQMFKVINLYSFGCQFESIPK